jgi:hypothetical protein
MTEVVRLTRLGTGQLAGEDGQGLFGQEILGQNCEAIGHDEISKKGG